jgi:hypothetical protein
MVSRRASEGHRHMKQLEFDLGTVVFSNTLATWLTALGA